MSDELTLKDDAMDVLQDEALVEGLEALAAVKSELPEGAVIKTEEEAPQGDQPDAQPAQPDVQPDEPEDWMDDLAALSDTEQAEVDVSPVAQEVARLMAAFLPQLSEAITGEVGNRLSSLESGLEDIRSQVKALATDDGAKVKAALDSSDGDWLTQMLRNTAQHAQVVKGGDVEEAKDSGYAKTFGNP